MTPTETFFRSRNFSRSHFFRFPNRKVNKSFCRKDARLSLASSLPLPLYLCVLACFSRFARGLASRGSGKRQQITEGRERKQTALSLFLPIHN